MGVVHNVQHEQNIPREESWMQVWHGEGERERERERGRAIKQLMPNKDLMRLTE